MVDIIQLLTFVEVNIIQLLTFVEGDMKYYLRKKIGFVDVHRVMNVKKKSNFNFYSYTLFLDNFCVLIVIIRC